VHHCLTAILGQLGAELSRHLKPSTIENVCHLERHTWCKRILDPVTTIHLFILQVLAGNTAMTHLRQLAHLSFTNSAYYQLEEALGSRPPRSDSRASDCWERSKGRG
jgi:hypothetical protein